MAHSSSLDKGQGLAQQLLLCCLCVLHSKLSVKILVIAATKAAAKLLPNDTLLNNCPCLPSSLVYAYVPFFLPVLFCVCVCCLFGCVALLLWSIVCACCLCAHFCCVSFILASGCVCSLGKCRNKEVSGLGRRNKKEASDLAINRQTERPVESTFHRGI